MQAPVVSLAASAAATTKSAGSPSQKVNNAPPGVRVKLPSGEYVGDPRSPTGYMMAPTSDLRDVAAAGAAIKKQWNAILNVPGMSLRPCYT